MTKMHVSNLFCTSNEAEGKTISYVQFIRIWKEVDPRIRIMTPVTDVCETCFAYREALIPKDYDKAREKKPERTRQDAMEKKAKKRANELAPLAILLSINIHSFIHKLQTIIYD